METEVRILIADDHPIFRNGLKDAIESDRRLKVVAETGDGADALSKIEALKPDVAVLDIDMPHLSGIEIARAVRQKRLAVEIIFLTMHKDEDLFNEALDSNVKGYVMKDSAVLDIIRSIEEVMAGRHYISPSISSYLVNRSARSASLLNRKPSLADLTQTEQRILKLIAESKTSREIADELGISTRTVENHRANICNKLEIHGSNALLRFAIEHKSQLL